MKYRYHLLKYHGKASRLTCPNCGKHHCFAPYVDDDEQMYGEEYGRCDHESSCGYVKYPPSDYDSLKAYRAQSNDWHSSSAPKRNQSHPYKPGPIVKPQPKPSTPEEVCTIPMDLVMKTIRTNPISTFLQFLLTIFTVEQILYVVQEYYIGVTKKHEAVFYEIDIQGRCRSGKIINFNVETGHRIKDESIGVPVNWVHTNLLRMGVLPKEWSLTQCLFGEHLLKRYPDKPVGLVESEKTAIICSVLVPDCIWLATGGKGQLNDRVEVLAGRKILAFPDVDGYETWVTKADERPHLGIIVSDLLERSATPEQREAHIDIADLLIKWRQEQPDYIPPITMEPPPRGIVSTNPVFLEVKKYFSPEFHENVLAMIEEFDLEFVGASRLVNTE